MTIKKRKKYINTQNPCTYAQKMLYLCNGNSFKQKV